MSTETTQQKLQTILIEVEDAALREELFHRFFVLNPLVLAKTLHAAVTLPDAVKSQVLSLKVGQPQPYKGVDLSPLIEKAMADLWARLAEEAKA